MRREHWLLRYALWALFLALLLGGRPWIFPSGPAGGARWLESLDTPNRHVPK